MTSISDPPKGGDIELWNARIYMNNAGMLLAWSDSLNDRRMAFNEWFHQTEKEDHAETRKGRGADATGRAFCVPAGTVTAPG